MKSKRYYIIMAVIGIISASIGFYILFWKLWVSGLLLFGLGMYFFGRGCSQYEKYPDRNIK